MGSQKLQDTQWLNDTIQKRLDFLRNRETTEIWERNEAGSGTVAQPQEQAPVDLPPPPPSANQQPSDLETIVARDNELLDEVRNVLQDAENFETYLSGLTEAEEEIGIPEDSGSGGTSGSLVGSG